MRKSKTIKPKISHILSLTSVEMVVCQYCGKESPQPDAAYCTYCGSSLRQQQPQQVAADPVSASSATAQAYGMPGSSITLSSDLLDRYEKALARVELLGTIVIFLAIVTLVLVLIA